MKDMRALWASIKEKKKIVIPSVAAGVVVVATSIGLAIGLSNNNKESGDVTLKFEANGVEISDIVKQKGEEVSLPVPEKEGYSFEGWYTNAEFEGSPVTTVVLDSNVTYYAKWTQLSVITLDTNGGSLSTTKVYAKKGETLYDIVKNYVPTKSGLMFGAWFNGTKELDQNTRVPEGAITLVAKYKVAYTVEVYVQNLDNDAYSKMEELTYDGSGYVDATISAELPDGVTGCTQISHADEVLTQKLTDKAANNVFALYFDRNTYDVVFDINYPDGTAAETYKVTGKYGAEISIPKDKFNYLREGYCMLGWGASKTSKDIIYATDLDDLLYQGGESTSETHTITIKGATRLYGVWKEGYTDMFGGDDYIYYVDGMGDVIYLARGDVFFKGTYDKERNEFNFNDILYGILFNNGKFLYEDNILTDTSVMFIAGVGINENVTLRFDGYSNFIYTQYDEGNNIIAEAKGTYEKMSGAEYRAVVTEYSGDISGVGLSETVYFRVGRNADNQSVFQIRSEEEYRMGTLIYTGFMANDQGAYVVGYMETMTVKFDGYGTATFTQNGSARTYNYQKNADGAYVLTDANDNEFGTIILSENTDIVTEAKGFFIYNKKLDTTIELGTGGTLTLDGIGNAVYEKDGKTITSYYTTSNMPMGSTMVSISEKVGTEYKTHKFLLTFSKIDENLVYSSKEVPSTYAEYYYKQEGSSLYYMPMLVIDEETAGYATLYGYNAGGEFVKVAIGTYEETEDGVYMFTRTETFPCDSIYEEPIDLKQVTSFLFTMDTMSGYNMHYWHSYEANGTTKELFTNYASGESTLKLVGGFAYYKETATMNVVYGMYTKSEDYITFSDKNGTTHYFKLDQNDSSFETLSFIPYTAYLLKDDNKRDENNYIVFDGKGNAVYTLVDADGNKTEINGTVTETDDKTKVGNDRIYLFTPSEGGEAFEYIEVTLNGSKLYLKEDSHYEGGVYFTTGKLTLDGYCYKAQYVDGDTEYEGNYFIMDGSVVFISQGKTFYFDKTEEGTDDFTLRGEEYGIYAMFKNQYAEDVYFEFDGYGELSMFTLIKEGDKYVRSEVTTGTYDKDGTRYNIICGAGDDTTAYVCEATGYIYQAEDEKTYNVLAMQAEVGRNVLIDNNDWSVLILDEFGGAIKYDELGNKQTGRYTRITENRLYFVNSVGTFNAYIYDYDMETGEAQIINYDAMSYYTEDLESLEFSQYGYAIFNGDMDNVLFYEYNEKDEVIIYRRSDVDANEYGFATYNFGKLYEKQGNEKVFVKEYEGKTYYGNTNGRDITFERVGDLTKYPIYMLGYKITVNSLTFAPAGSLDFNVTGEVNITREKEGEATRTETVSCRVVRENGEMYINFQGFRLYITAQYAGNTKDQVSTCEALDLRYQQEMSSYLYLNWYYRSYISNNVSGLKNTVGTITLKMEFNEEGKEESHVMSATFGEDSHYYDTNGKALTEIKETNVQMVGETGMYYVEVQMEDGYTYRVYYAMQSHQYLGATGYFVYAFVRMQDIAVEDSDYTVTVGRTIASEYSSSLLGNIFVMDIKKDGVSVGEKVEVEGDISALYEKDGKYYFIDREKDADGRTLSATYYYVTLKESATVPPTGSEDHESFATYTEATVTEGEATILHEADNEKLYVEIVNGKVEMLFLTNNVYYVSECTYDEETATYTVTSTKRYQYNQGNGSYTMYTSKKVYTVKVDGDYVVIEEVKVS